MPPKAAAGAGNEAFLATCVKCAFSKLDVDFDLVAKATGMSKGGAGNKFRSIMKQFEDEGAIFTGNATTPAKAPLKRKVAPKKAATEAEAEANGAEGEGDTDGDTKPAAKKAKSAPRKKGTAVAKPKKKVVEASASEEDVDGNEQVEAADEEEA